MSKVGEDVFLLVHLFYEGLKRRGVKCAKDKVKFWALPGYISSVQGLVSPVGRVWFSVHAERLLCGGLEVIQPGEMAR